MAEDLQTNVSCSEDNRSLWSFAAAQIIPQSLQRWMHAFSWNLDRAAVDGCCKPYQICKMQTMTELSDKPGQSYKTQTRTEQ